MWYADIEGDGLLSVITKLHCAVFKNAHSGAWRKFIHGEEKKLEEFLATAGTLVMHNGACFDKPALNKLGITCNNPIIDTLHLAWFLEPDVKRAGLAYYGEKLGIKKPEVDDGMWKVADMSNPEHRDLMLNRCTEDVRIQEAVWLYFKEQLDAIYEPNPEDLPRFLKYLQLRGEILRLKEKNRWKLNVTGAEELLEHLENEAESKRVELSAVMPKTKAGIKTKPKVYFKKNGDKSANGVKWDEWCEANGLDANADSHQLWKDPQPHYMPEVKEWLSSLGWVPETFEFKRNKETGEVRQIPQVTIKNGGGKICKSIKKLAKEVPEVQALVGYSLINHRKGFVKAMLESVDNEGYLYAGVNGFTNTLRSKHSRPLANIPSPRAKYGSEIRALLCCEAGQKVIGSDMASLEDRWKHHYQWPIDPNYVKTQMAPDFDPHLLVACSAGLITSEEMAYYKANKDSHDEEITRIGLHRQVGKGGNYSCQYGAGAATVARTCGVSEAVGRKIHKGYWDLNWSIKKISSSTIVRKAANKMWQQNPVNKFWYMLKTEKDRFSTLVQGSGAYSFDVWIGNMIKLCKQAWNAELPLIGDFHDEVILRIKDDPKHYEVMQRMMRRAIELTNQELKLNRELDIDIQIGDNYSHVH